MPNASEMARVDAEEIVETTLKVWTCKIGEVDPSKVPPGGDNPMRRAIARAYTELTGEEADFIFSGWGGQLGEHERAVVDNRIPDPAKIARENASLGYATTQQLLDELQARATIGGYAGYSTMYDFDKDAANGR